MNSAALSLASNIVRGHCDEKLLQFHERESVLFSALGHAHLTSELDEAKQAFWDNYTSIDTPTRFVIPCPLPIFQVFPRASDCLQGHGYRPFLKELEKYTILWIMGTLLNFMICEML